jgi:hypothetical protein
MPTQPIRRRASSEHWRSTGWNPSEAIQARVSFGAALREISQTGTRDLQDRGVHFRLTFFPLRLLRR